MSNPVVVIAPTPPPMHGAALATQRLLDQLRDAGFSVVHINAKYSDTVDGLGSFSFRKIRLMMSYLARALALAIKQRRAIFIVEPAMYFGPFVKDSVFVLGLKLCGANVIAWHHMALASMWMSVGSSPWKRRFVAFVLRRLSHHVVAGNSVCRQLQEVVAADKISIIANGIPAEECSQAANETEQTSSEFRVLYLSNMGEAKGYKVLLEAAKQLGSAHTNLRVDFFGNLLPGQQESELLEEFRLAQQHCAVAYHGPVYGAAKARAYAQADVFVLPSFNEAFPLTILEAMSTGTAVIATDVGSVADAVEHNVTGFVVEPRSSDQLAECLQQLYKDRVLCKKLGQAGKKRFQERYTLDTFGTQWSEFLSKQ